jgi:hypothetical protein
MPHSREGFGEAAELFGSLRGRTGLAPSAVYEATGVYAAPLLNFLRGLGCPVYRISPLESAKMRKAEIRPTKNDSLDTGTIAKVFYSREIRRLAEEDGLRLSLREMGGELQYRTAAAVAGKNRYRRLLDECWPLFDGVIEYDSDASLNIVAHFGHPSRIRTADGRAPRHHQEGERQAPHRPLPGRREDLRLEPGIEGREVLGQEKRRPLSEGRQDSRMQQAGPDRLRHAHQRDRLFR